MIIEVSRLEKSFNHQQIFKNLTFTFEQGKSYAILGPNGSGKSTLLKILAGYMIASSGKIIYKENNEIIDPDDWYKYLLIAAPYMELPEELTLKEFLKFHFHFKKLRKDYNLDTLLEKSGLQGRDRMQLRHFSSGMKQRLKLAISMYSTQKILFLDEPATNLDASGIEWFRREIELILAEKLVIIASNNFVEHDFCQNSLNLSDLK